MMVLSADFESKCREMVMQLATETAEKMIQLFREEVERFQTDERRHSLVIAANSDQVIDPAVSMASPQEDEEENETENQPIDLSLSTCQLVSSNISNDSTFVPQSESLFLSLQNNSATEQSPATELESSCNIDTNSNVNVSDLQTTSNDSSAHQNNEPPEPAAEPAASLPIESANQPTETAAEINDNAGNSGPVSVIQSSNETNAACSLATSVKVELNEASVEVPLPNTAFDEHSTTFTSHETGFSCKSENEYFYDEDDLLYLEDNAPDEEAETEGVNENGESLMTTEESSEMNSLNASNSETVDTTANDDLQNNTSISAVSNNNEVAVTPNLESIADQTPIVSCEPPVVRSPVKRKHSLNENSELTLDNSEPKAKRKLTLATPLESSVNAPKNSDQIENQSIIPLNNAISEQSLNLQNNFSKSTFAKTHQQITSPVSSSNTTPSQKRCYSKNQTFTSTSHHTGKVSNSSKHSSSSSKISASEPKSTTNSSKQGKSDSKSSKSSNSPKTNTHSKEKASSSTTKRTSSRKSSGELSSSSSDNDRHRNTTFDLNKIKMIKVLELRCKKSLCFKVFPKEKDLVSHMRDVHNQKLFNCLVADCEAILRNKDEWIDHSKDVHRNALNRKQLSCHCCSKTFHSELYLFYHYILQHEHGKFSCSRCNSFEGEKRIFVYQHLIEGRCDKVEHCRPSTTAVSPSTSAHHRQKKSRSRSRSSSPPLQQPKHRTFSASSDWRAVSSGEQIGDTLKVISLDCMRCDAKFPNEQQLIGHMALDHKKGFFACLADKCSLVFNSRETLLAHMKNDKLQHGKTFQCSFCPGTFTKAEDLLSHATNQHQTGEFACTFSTCLNLPAFHSRAKFSAHYTKIHVSKFFEESLSCTETDCSTTFSKKRELVDHLRKKHKIEEFPCFYCSKSYKNWNDRKQHIDQTHRSLSRVCPLCKDNREHTSQNSIHKHIVLSHHQGVFSCTYTGCKYKAHYRNDVLNHYYKEHKEEQSNTPATHQLSSRLLRNYD